MCLLLLHLVWHGVASPTEPDCLNLQASSAPSVQGRLVAVPSLGTLSPLPFCLLLCCPTLCLRSSKTRSTWLPLLTFLVWPHPFFNNPLSLVPVSLLYLQSWWHKLWRANSWISATFSQANLSEVEPEPQLLFDGHAILTSTPKRQRRRIKGIVSWTEAFSVFSLVLVFSLPTSLA